MNISRCLLSSALLAGTVFSASTLPLTALGSKPVTIQLGEKPVFVGEVEEFAAPYLGLATAISLGAGVVSLAAAGWRQSSRKLSLAEEQVSTLKQQLDAKTTLIEDLKFSEFRLSTSGLEGFLEDEGEVHRPQAAQNTTAEAHYLVMGSAQPIDQTIPAQPAARMAVATPVQQQQVSSTHGAGYVVSPTVNHQVKTQAATALSSAQAFMGFTRPKQASEAATALSTQSHQPESVAQLDDLLNHLKHVMSQIENLHADSSTQERSVHGSAANWQQHKLAS